MKEGQLLEKVKNVETWSDAWDTTLLFFNDNEQTGHLFSFTKKPDGYLCELHHQTKKTNANAKEVTYTQKFVLKEFGDNMPLAFKAAALKHLESKNKKKSEE